MAVIIQEAHGKLINAFGNINMDLGQIIRRNIFSSSLYAVKNMIELMKRSAEKTSAGLVEKEKKCVDSK